jgi:hypothetical protein
MKEAIFQLLFPDKHSNIKNLALAYNSARRTIKSISLETNFSKAKEIAEGYLKPNVEHIRWEIE